MVAYVEVAIAQGLFVRAFIYPIPIHAHRTEHHLLVVLPQISVYWKNPFRFQFYKHRVDELYHVIPPPSRQLGIDLCQELQSPQFPGLSAEVDIPWVVFPEVTIRRHRDLMSQRAQSLGQRGVYVTIFSQQQYPHLSLLINGSVRIRKASPIFVFVSRRNHLYFFV